MSAWKQLMEDIFGARPEAPPKPGANVRLSTKTLASNERITPPRDSRSPRTEERSVPDTLRDLPFPEQPDETPVPARHVAEPWDSRPAEPRRAAESEARPPGPALLVAGAVGVLSLVVSVLSMGSSVAAAKQRLLAPDEASRPNVAVAQQAEVGYCTKDFKEVLERVLHSCGLADQTERRGCKPSDIKTFAAISDTDFNSLFLPLQQRGGVLMFDDGSDELDAAGKRVLEERWYDRKGARYFFVVARASKTGNPEKNRALSHRRANSVLFYLKEISGETEAELNEKVGLLWLGNEYAQLSQEYCSWPRSRTDARCDEEAINRSAFVSWVDCRL
jgi:outer membrane protein OmpA-like peptidoglycan-associated protein